MGGNEQSPAPSDYDASGIPLGDGPHGGSNDQASQDAADALAEKLDGDNKDK